MSNENNSSLNHPIIIVAAAVFGAVAAVAGFFIGRSTAPQTETNPAYKTTDPTCSICLVDIIVTQERYLKCGHVFHKECIEEWINCSRRTCPNCNLKF